MIPSTPLVGIVIVNYNGRRFLPDCLNALLSGTRDNFEIVLVDNASTDGSAEATLVEFPIVTVIRQSRNLGVAAGNNAGIAYCRERGFAYILLLNYDTLPEATLLEQLLIEARPDTLVSGYTLSWDDASRSNSHAGGFDWTLGRLRETFFGEAFDATESVKDVEIADTCCLLVPREVFEVVGMMDAAYFMYYDDTDFVVRARRAGFRCLLNPRARLRHYERGATGSTDVSPISVYYSTRNRPYFMKKHAPSRFRYWLFLVYFAVTRTASVVRWIASGKFQKVEWTITGLTDYAFGRMGPGHLSRVRAEDSV